VTAKKRRSPLTGLVEEALTGTEAALAAERTGPSRKRAAFG
jgi:hypothetical protein